MTRPRLHERARHAAMRRKLARFITALVELIVFWAGIEAAAWDALRVAVVTWIGK
jgi:hypothetical protein